MKKLITVQALSSSTDDNALRTLAPNPHSLDDALLLLVRNTYVKNRLSDYVIRNNGRISCVDEVFQEGVCAFAITIRNAQSLQHLNVNRQLLQACIKVWKEKYESDYLRNQAKSEKKEVNRYLDLVDDSALEVITLWKLNYSYQQISTTLELGSANNVKAIINNTLLLINEHTQRTNDVLTA